MLGFDQIISICENAVGRKFSPVSDGWHVSGEVFLRPAQDRLLVIETHPNGEEASISSIGMAAPKQLVESFANELSLFVRDAE
jgi:hypothetical protein